MTPNILQEAQDFLIKDGYFLKTHNDISDIKFDHNVITEHLRNGGVPLYRVYKDCAAYFKYEGESYRLSLKKNDESDGASVPSFLCDAVVPPHLIEVPAFVHDKGYRGGFFEKLNKKTGEWEKVPRDQCDFDIFFRALIEWWLEGNPDENPAIIAFLAYRGVALEGHKHFKK